MGVDNGKYYRKWSITYRGKPYLQIYGKRNAYDLLHRLSKYYLGLGVAPFMEEPDMKTKKARKPSGGFKLKPAELREKSTHQG